MATMMGTLELPPRRSRRTQEMTIQRNRSSLEILLQMGFPKHRAERALAATGDKGVQLASDWLLSHVNDPTLDDKVPRDYILYLCPVGQLQQEFLDFWQKSYQDCGWNRAHNYFPHITLCSFFQAEDSLVSQLSHAIKKVAERVTNAPETVEFDYFSSTNFIGLFITEQFSSLLKQITTDFAEEMKKAGMTVEPHKKQLHVSLAYQFPTDKKEKLEQLARAINLKAPARWDLRLYSRDAQKGRASYQVRKVLYTHVPGAPDELEMCDGDFIFMEEKELEASTDGWYFGASWMTGCTGMFPGVYTERTAETETWTMHRSIPIVGTDLMKNEFNGLLPGEVPFGYGTQMTRHRLSGIPCVGTLGLSGNTVRRAGVGSSDTLISGSSVINAVRSDHKVLMSSSSLAAIPEGAATVSSVPGSGASGSATSSVSSAVPASAAAAKSSGARSQSHSSSGGAMSAVVSVSNAVVATASVASPAAAHVEPNRTVLAGEGRSSSPKHSSVSLISGGTSRTSVLDAGTTSKLSAVTAKGPRQLFVVRHGERIDFTFGKDWIQNSFNAAGSYIRYDLNMPKTLPRRKGGPQDFSLDSPLTVQGHFQARLLGEAMKEKDVQVMHVYASPSLRSVETACSMLQGLGISREVNVEPGLFEWLGWYIAGAPKFLAAQDLHDRGLMVNLSYLPIWPLSKYNVQETTEQFYERSYQVTKDILKKHEDEGGNVLIVAHGISLDSCTRQLVGQQARSQTGFHEILHKIPYCAISVAQEATVVRDTWYLIEPPVLPFAHTNNPKYNWTSLTTPALV